MHDPFDEYEKASVSPPEGTKLPPGGTPQEQPPEYLPPEPYHVPVTSGPSTAEKVDEWIGMLVKWAFWFLGLVLIAILVWWLFVKIQPNFETKPPEVIETTTYEVPAETQKELKQLRADVPYLKNLLAKVRRQLRVEKENHATTRLRLERALVAKAADEKYQQFLKYALDQFYERPFKEGEEKRTICFTTNTMDKECLQLDRPKGWFEGKTILPEPARLRRL